MPLAEAVANKPDNKEAKDVEGGEEGGEGVEEGGREVGEDGREEGEGTPIEGKPHC
jgi:hypothetical protein